MERAVLPCTGREARPLELPLSTGRACAPDGAGGKNLHGPAVLVTVVTTATAMTHFFLPVYLKQTLGFSGSQIGLLYALFSVTTLLAVVPVGLRNDRSSPRAMIALSLALAAAAALGMAGARRFPVFVGVFLLYGLGLAALRISMDALMFKSGGTARSGFRWGIFNGFRMVGMTLGTLGAGHVLARWSFPAGLGLMAVVLAAALIIPVFLSPVKVGFPGMREYLEDLKAPGVLGFMTWLFLFSLHWGAELTSYGLFLREGLGLTLSGMGWYMSLEFVIVGLTCFWAGPRCDRGMDVRTLAVWGMLLSGAGQVFMCSPDVAVSLFWRGVHGVGDGLILIVMYLGVARLFHPDRVGGLNSGVTLVMMLGTFAGSLVFGPMGAALGYDVPLKGTGVLVVALAIPLVRQRVRKTPGPPGDTGAPLPVVPESP